MEGGRVGGRGERKSERGREAGEGRRGDEKGVYVSCFKRPGQKGGFRSQRKGFCQPLVLEESLLMFEVCCSFGTM
jgi:hypothetical protein